jgi:hypothetical protein
VAIRLIDLISRAYAVDGHMLHIGASVGIALFPDDGHDPTSFSRMPIWRFIKPRRRPWLLSVLRSRT